MYQVGDLIVYAMNGICRVTEIGPKPELGGDADTLYYTLTPLYRTEVIYTPVDANQFMRPALTRKKALELIAQIPAIEEQELDSRNMKLAAEYYQNALRTHDCTELVRLIKTIYTKNQAARLQRKNLSQIDQRYMKRAEDLLYGELGTALGIQPEGVQQYIEQTVAELQTTVQ